MASTIHVHIDDFKIVVLTLVVIEQKLERGERCIPLPSYEAELGVCDAWRIEAIAVVVEEESGDQQAGLIDRDESHVLVNESPILGGTTRHSRVHSQETLAAEEECVIYRWMAMSD